MADPDRSELGRQLRNHPRRLQERTCAQCGTVFEAETRRARYCSNRCKMIGYRSGKRFEVSPETD